ncbi:MAG: sigma-70 family RNA polymerase sigma factor [Planctomycetaceae bacterium]|nr:sigma-70 family RNA polymerase sigma factor [Planctomycetales bacterium]MCB9937168.1 sigma-70 family RNA polymerase sigma factor [Planctomycetaceae bacterium]
MLDAARAGIQEGWRRLYSLYLLFIYGWLRSNSALHHDADDLTQATMTIIAEKIDTVDHSGRPDAFRELIRRILAFESMRYWRERGSKGGPKESSDQIQWLAQVEDPNSDLATQWNLEHDR